MISALQSVRDKQQFHDLLIKADNLNNNLSGS